VDRFPRRHRHGQSRPPDHRFGLNVEIGVKTLDGTAFNGHFWDFYGALTSVEFDLTVTDVSTGRTKTYHNPSRTFASRGDTEAFSATEAASERFMHYEDLQKAAKKLDSRQGACAPSSRRLCLLDGRFALEMSWNDFKGNEGPGSAVANPPGRFASSGDTAAF